MTLVEGQSREPCWLGSHPLDQRQGLVVEPEQAAAVAVPELLGREQQALAPSQEGQQKDQNWLEVVEERHCSSF